MTKFLTLLALAMLVASPAVAAPSDKEVEAAVSAYLASKTDPANREEAVAIGNTVADLDKDSADEIVLTWTTMGASYSHDNVSVLKGTPGAFTEAATFSVNGTTEKPQVKDGVITVEQMTFAKGDPVCCPSVKKTVTYNFDGKSLTEK
jgi:hypothetical protein